MPLQVSIKAQIRDTGRFEGGRISVGSEPGKGSVFTVVLPVLTGEGKAA